MIFQLPSLQRRGMKMKGRLTIEYCPYLSPFLSFIELKGKGDEAHLRHTGRDAYPF
ncbi:MAG TPA: hypothetical protein ACFYD3_02225 [Candidatus Hypogeohydataceae bacterium YC41]